MLLTVHDNMQELNYKHISGDETRRGSKEGLTSRVRYFTSFGRTICWYEFAGESSHPLHLLYQTTLNQCLLCLSMFSPQRMVNTPVSFFHVDA